MTEPNWLIAEFARPAERRASLPGMDPTPMTKLPKLYPNHRHQWVDGLDPVWWWCNECKAYECGWCGDFNADHESDVEEHAITCPDRPETVAVTCTVCGFTVPRNLAKLDGEPAPKEPA